MQQFETLKKTTLTVPSDATFTITKVGQTQGYDGHALRAYSYFGEHMPDTLFLAPDAPEACAGSPMGYQWFPIPWLDGSSEEESAHQPDQANLSISPIESGGPMTSASVTVAIVQPSSEISRVNEEIVPETTTSDCRSISLVD